MAADEMRMTFAKMVLLVFCAMPDFARSTVPEEPIFPAGWSPPRGWYVDERVKRAVADGNVTGSGLPARAVLLTNGVIVDLFVFVNYKSHTFKAYSVFHLPAADLKSDLGIIIRSTNKIEVEPVPGLCNSKWISCNKEHKFFDPPMPTLWLHMGDWGSSVFRWRNAEQGFDRLALATSKSVMLDEQSQG